MVPAVISRIVWRMFSSLPVFTCLVIYVVVFTFSPQGGTATEQAGTARLSILHLSQAAFQLVPQTTQKNPSMEKRRPPSKKKEKKRNLQRICFVWEKVNKSEIHRETQNNTKQNRALKKAKGEERQRGEVWDKEWATLDTRKTLSTHSPGLDRQ